MKKFTNVTATISIFERIDLLLPSPAIQLTMTRHLFVDGI